MLLGCDFSSTPTRRKPILLALGEETGGRVQLARIERFESLGAFGDWLREPRVVPHALPPGRFQVRAPAD